LSKSAVQIGQLALQIGHALLELGIFFSQGFWDFQIVTAVTANGSIVVDIFGAKRATHDNEPRNA
jgi:hypothetical protein